MNEPKVAQPPDEATSGTTPPTASGTPPLAHSGPRRQAHRRADAAYLEQAWPRATVLVVEPATGSALMRDGLLVLVPAVRAPAGERAFLGEDDEGTPYFAVFAELPDVDGAVRVGVRDAGHLLPDLHGGLLLTSVALANWHAGHAYSPLDGSLTTVTDAGWSRTADDGKIFWPRTDPAVIVLVHDGRPGQLGRCLLGHNATWSRPGWTKRYSTLAGFVEAGESAEAAVAREVEEEVGVVVRDLRYGGSQAWPYPGSLMLGFFAVADPEAPVRVDQSEISDAQWFTRDDIAAVLDGERVDFGLPMPASIAHFLIRRWLGGHA